MAQRTPELELDNQLCFALYTASRATVRAYGPLLDDLGLTYPQYLTMLALWEAPDGLAVGEIGARLHLDSGTLTPLLKRLEGIGYVERTRDPADERRVVVTLTAEGRALRQRARGVPRKIAARFGLDAASGRRLLDDLRALVEVLDAEAGTASDAE